jgi:hypothetical protein
MHDRGFLKQSSFLQPFLGYYKICNGWSEISRTQPTSYKFSRFEPRRVNELDVVLDRTLLNNDSLQLVERSSHN